MFAYEWVAPLLEGGRYAAPFARSQEWFAEYGFLAILVAGFSPIPYKVFTITAGVLSMSFVPFVLASIIGRGGRFYLVSLLMAWGGAPGARPLPSQNDAGFWLPCAPALNTDRVNMAKKSRVPRNALKSFAVIVVSLG